MTRRQPAGHVRNGVVLGAAVALIDIAILVLSGTAFQMLFALSNVARVGAGALGGWLASGMSGNRAA